MFDPSTEGMYICQLLMTDNYQGHVIGIDCDRNLILDGCERYALTLSMKNIHYCCGSRTRSVKRILYCYQLVKQEHQKKK